MWLSMLLLPAALALLVTLLIHVKRGRGNPVAGVPRMLWILGLFTLDPLIALSYLAFVVFGLLGRSAWRTLAVYGVFALVAALHFGPLSWSSHGVYPAQSARPRGLLVDVSAMGASFGVAEPANHTHVALGNGWLARRAVIVSDGDPVSAAVVDRVANALVAAGIPKVDFVQSEDALPAPFGDLIVAVGVHDVSSLDLVAAAYWSGEVSVTMGEQPFSHADHSTYVDGISGDKRRWGEYSTDVGGGSLWLRWSVDAVRIGPTWGASSVEFVQEQLVDLEEGLDKVLLDSRHGGLASLSSDAALGDWTAPDLGDLLEPFTPQALVAGAGVLSDQGAFWRVDFGPKPARGLEELERKLTSSGWSEVERTTAYYPSEHVRHFQYWHLSARRDVAGDRQYLQVRPSRGAMYSAGAYVPMDLSDYVEAPFAPGEYIVQLVDRFGPDRLAALVGRLLDEGGDDRLLRTLGPCAPSERYAAWRKRVLASDARVLSLLCVARSDHERGLRTSAKALTRVAGWVMARPRLGDSMSDRLAGALRHTASIVGIEDLPLAGSLDAGVLDGSGLPLLSGSWRPVPYLKLARGEKASTPALSGYARDEYLRRFVSLDAAGQPVLLSLEVIDVIGGDDWLVLNIHGEKRRQWMVKQLSAGAVGVDKPGGRFEVRANGGVYAARWLLPE